LFTVSVMGKPPSYFCFHVILKKQEFLNILF